MPKINETIHSPNQSSRGNHIPQLIVFHLADGTYEGTKAWFANTASQTSSHFVIARDGRICQCVPLNKMAWCNGTSPYSHDNKFYGLSSVELVGELGGNANQYSVSVEFEGFWSESPRRYHPAAARGGGMAVRLHPGGSQETVQSHHPV